MEYGIVIIFSLVGCCVGLGIPKFSIRLIEKKLAINNLARKENALDRKWFLAVIAVVNGSLWGIVGFSAPSILEAGIIGCFGTLALMFTIIDLCIHIIPNELVIITGVLGIFYQLVAYGPKNFLLAVISMAVIFALFLILGLIIGLHKIGAGDVKLVGIMGLVLGFPNILYGILFMSIAIMAYCVFGIVIGKLTHVSMFPFAPFIMFGMVCAFAVILFPDLGIMLFKIVEQ